jgi:hypothetical protein
MSARLREIVANTRFTAAQCVECAKPVFSSAIRCVGCTADKYRRENPNCVDCGKPLDTPWIRCWSCLEDDDTVTEYDPCNPHGPWQAYSRGYDGAPDSKGRYDIGYGKTKGEAICNLRSIRAEDA